MICKCSRDRKLGLRWLREKKTILRVLGFHVGIPRRIVRMTLKQIASLGKELAKFLALFACCFRSRPGFALCKIYVQGLLSSLQRKNVEAIALEFGKRPRTLQRFVESIKWDELHVRDDCQRLVASAHAHEEAVGCIDESGTAKSGVPTVGAARQWLGSRGKVDNGVVGVHLSYCAPGFQCLLDSEVYLPQEWADDPVRRKKTTSPTRSCSAPSRRSPWGFFPYCARACRCWTILAPCTRCWEGSAAGGASRSIESKRRFIGPGSCHASCSTARRQNGWTSAHLNVAKDRAFARFSVPATLAPGYTATRSLGLGVWRTDETCP